ncbi:hypothetical protein, partial [Sansalvadorimonas verongulae]|uniref:hypothetical protein n=1 Tax=Sansalvadorimonas verongulae TaxID=2172824 RepID=UPI0018AD2DD5
RAMKQALPLTVLCLFYPLEALAVKIDPKTGLPFTDDVLLQHMMGKKDKSGGADFSGLNGPLEARELLFDQLVGVNDTVVSIYEPTFTLTIKNDRERKALNDMGLRFSLAIYPVVNGMRTRGRFIRRGLSVKQHGVLKQTIPLEAFYQENATDYSVSLSYESLNKIPIEITRFYLQVSPLPPEISWELRGREALYYELMPEATVLGPPPAMTAVELEEGATFLQNRGVALKKNILVLDLSKTPADGSSASDNAVYQY